MLEACNNKDANMAYDLFMAEYKRIYDKAFPKKPNRNKGKPVFKHPWMTRGLLKSSKRKAQLHLKYIKNPTLANKNKFISYRNRFKTIRIKAEKYYYAVEFSKHSSNLKKTWTLIRNIVKMGEQDAKIESLKINGIKNDDPEAMANIFNNLFSDIAHTLAEQIPNSRFSFTKYLDSPIPHSFGLIPTSPEEINNLSHSIHDSHSRGVDDIDPHIAISYIPLIASQLAEIINCSLNTGVVPDAIKIAKIVPIYKKGDRDNPANYRPISILPFFSKYFEKIMYDRLNNFIEKSHILFPHQYGFQSGRSTYMPLMNIYEKISNAFENNEYSIGIFFDLAKAFDTVNHDILLQKLANYGIRGTQLAWFNSYLDNRLQCVSCNGALSGLRRVKYGVPQGSNLGPILFLIYINDLPNISPILSFILFADDTNVFYSHKSYHTLVQTINSELISIAEWFCANRLSLNLEKTNYILFRSHKKMCPPSDSLQLSINGTFISQVNSAKFLGVHIDQHLTWNDHIKNISAKIAKNVGILKRVSYILPSSIRAKLYYSLIYPYLSYCNFVWASTYESRLHKLVLLQKRGVRVVAGASSIAHTSPLFLEFNLLKFHQIKTFQTGIFMYRFAHNLLPPNFTGYFQQGADIHSHLTRSSKLYRAIYAHSNSLRFSIKFTGPSVWSSIPLTIQQVPNLQRFKKLFRAYLIDDITNN